MRVSLTAAASLACLCLSAPRVSAWGHGYQAVPVVQAAPVSGYLLVPGHHRPRAYAGQYVMLGAPTATGSGYVAPSGYTYLAPSGYTQYAAPSGYTQYTPPSGYYQWVPSNLSGSCTGGQPPPSGYTGCTGGQPPPSGYTGCSGGGPGNLTAGPRPAANITAPDAGQTDIDRRIARWNAGGVSVNVDVRVNVNGSEVDGSRGAGGRRAASDLAGSLQTAYRDDRQAGLAQPQQLRAAAEAYRNAAARLREDGEWKNLTEVTQAIRSAGALRGITSKSIPKTRAAIRAYTTAELQGMDANAALDAAAKRRIAQVLENVASALDQVN